MVFFTGVGTVWKEKIGLGEEESMKGFVKAETAKQREVQLRNYRERIELSMQPCEKTKDKTS